MVKKKNFPLKGVSERSCEKNLFWVKEFSQKMTILSFTISYMSKNQENVP